MPLHLANTRLDCLPAQRINPASMAGYWVTVTVLATVLALGMAIVSLVMLVRPPGRPEARFRRKMFACAALGILFSAVWVTVLVTVQAVSFGSWWWWLIVAWMLAAVVIAVVLRTESSPRTRAYPRDAAATEEAQS